MAEVDKEEVRRLREERARLFYLLDTLYCHAEPSLRDVELREEIEQRLFEHSQNQHGCMQEPWIR